MSAITSDAKTRRRSRLGGQNAGRPSGLWAVPGIVYFGLLALVPLAIVVYLSFTSWSGLGSPQLNGLANWRQILSDPVLLQSVGLSLLFTALAIVTLIPTSLLLGVWAAGKQKARAVLVAIYFIPLLSSGAAVALVWRSILDPNFGIPAQFPWLFGNGDLFGHPASAIGIITFVGLWQFTPLYTLIFQGAARAIPEVLYQAAEIDGAGRWRQFWNVTVPQLRNTLITSLILTTIGGLTTFDTILILTQGGPGTSTTNTAFYMYNIGFEGFQFGPASAIAVILIVVATGVSVTLVRASGYDKMLSTQEGI